MILYSKQLFFYVLHNYPSIIQKVYLSKDIDNTLFRQIKNTYKGDIIKLDNKKAQAMARGNNHQGFFLEIQEQYFSSIKDISLDKSSFILVLSGITDIGNIGAIVRSAYCLGVDAVIICGVNTMPIEHIIRTSVGSFFEIPVVCFKDILDVISRLQEKGFECFGATTTGDNVKDIVFKEKRALIMGNEHTGLTNKVLKKLDKEISIKMKTSFDSLNVSSASAILIDRMS